MKYIFRDNDNHFLNVFQNIYVVLMAMTWINLESKNFLTPTVITLWRPFGDNLYNSFQSSGVMAECSNGIGTCK